MQCMWLLVFTGLLLILSIYDIRTKKIPRWGLILLFILSLIYLLFSGERDTDVPGIIMSVLPGCVLGVMSYITEGKIGMGDAIVILALGLGLGTEKTVYALCCALIIICLFCIIMLLLKKIRRSSRIPFVPFITIGMGVIGFVFR